MTDSKMCPECKKWIPMPLRRQRAAFDAHIKKEHPTVWLKQEQVREGLYRGTPEPVAQMDPEIAKAALAKLRAELVTANADYAQAEGVRRAQLGNVRAGILRRIIKLNEGVEL